MGDERFRNLARAAHGALAGIAVAPLEGEPLAEVVEKAGREFLVGRRAKARRPRVRHSVSAMP